MDKLKMHSPNITDENIAKLAELFPSCITESKDADGHLTGAIDFDQLKQELSNNIVEGPQERYQLNWPGKREALLTANAPIAKTLRPCREESVDFDTTENLFIEGDNLDVLKLLQETYLGKVKMIYIDPPYNTGNDFIYADDFSESSEEYLLSSGQRDEEGNRLVANSESNGRFHSDWLSMMYPRLKLARNLLRDDGVFFVSIDDNEFENLKKLCDEVFGSDQYIGTFTINATPNARDYGHIGKMHEYIHFYAKDRNLAQTSQLVVADKIFKFTDKYGGFNIHPLYNSNEAFTSLNRPNLYFPIFLYPDQITENSFYKIGFEELPGSMKILPPKSEKNSVQFVWRWGKEKCLANFNKEIVGYKTGSGVYRIVQKMRHTTKIVRSILDDKSFSSRRGTAEVEELFKGKIASFPKPVELLKTLVQVGSKEDDLIMDFFAGSSTTAESITRLNAEASSNRKFIMVQLPEICDENSEAAKFGYSTIAEISKERIRLAGNKIKEDNPEASDLDVGFRVLKIDDSNMSDVYYAPDSINQADLSLFSDNIKGDRSSEDLLFQVLLDWGVDLTLPIKKETIAGREVFFVDGNALAACFDKEGQVDEEFCKELAVRKILRVVFRDAGFKDDSVKINVEQIFKLLSPHSDLKTI